jgi:hypothetical protein
MAMDCLICKDLKRVLEFRRGEYFEARAAAYYRVTTELAAYTNVDMERAKNDWQEHQLVCPRATEVSQSGARPAHI